MVGERDVNRGKYRVGVIGCGRIGRGSIEDEIINLPGRTILPYSHAGAVRDIPELELVAGADPSEAALSDFTARWGVKRTYKTFKEMLSRESPDIVCVATSSPAHCEAVLASVDAGVRGIFCEKPLATTLEEGDMMVEACERAGVHLSVDHYRRWEPYYVRAKELLEHDRIGKLISLVGHIGEPMSFGGTHLADAFRMYAGDADWVFGHVDELRFAGGSESVFQDVKGGAAAYVQFKGGVRGLMSQDYGFEVDMIGTKGRIKVSDSMNELWDGAEKDLMWGTLKNAGFPATFRHTSPMVSALHELIGCVEDPKATSVSDGRQASATMEVIVGAFESARRNAPVKLPLVDRKLGVMTA